MQIDLWTLALQTLNAVVLLWILSRFLFKPVAAMMKARKEAADRLLADAEAARSAAEAAKADAESAAARLADESNATIAKAEAEAEAARQEIISRGTAEANALKAAAETEIAALRKSREAGLRREVAELAVEATARLLSRLPVPVSDADFIDSLGEGVGRLPEATRKSIGADASRVLIRAASGLSTDQQAHLRDVLERSIGRSINPEILGDPSLLAGLELETDHAVVRNNFRADLDRIVQEMASHV